MCNDTSVRKIVSSNTSSTHIGSRLCANHSCLERSPKSLPTTLLEVFET